MKKISNGILLVVLCAALAICFIACSGRNNGPETTERPTHGVGTTPSIMQTPVAQNTPDNIIANPSPSPQGTNDVNASPGVGETIEGFMEGKVVDPDDVPDIVKALKDSEKYGKMTVQSITQELYEGRHAYKVTLQGEGSASETVFVYPNGEIVGAEDGGSGKD